MADEASEGEDYVVESLIERKFENNEELFLVKWKNFDDSQSTWEPRSNLEANCKALIAEFERKVMDQTEEVKEIDNVRMVVDHAGNKLRLYHVIWGDDIPSWEPEQNLRVTKPCAALVDRFDEKQAQAQHLLGELNRLGSVQWKASDFQLADGHALDYSKIRKAITDCEKAAGMYQGGAAAAAGGAAAGAADGDSAGRRRKRGRAGGNGSDEDDAAAKRRRVRGGKQKGGAGAGKANGVESGESESEEEEYEVEKILDLKKMQGQWKYLIKWEGFDEQHNTWEPKKNFQHLTSLIAEFEERRKQQGQKPTR